MRGFPSKGQMNRYALPSEQGNESNIANLKHVQFIVHEYIQEGVGLSYGGEGNQLWHF